MYKKTIEIKCVKHHLESALQRTLVFVLEHK